MFAREQAPTLRLNRPAGRRPSCSRPGGIPVNRLNLHLRHSMGLSLEWHYRIENNKLLSARFRFVDLLEELTGFAYAFGSGKFCSPTLVALVAHPLIEPLREFRSYA